MRRVGYARGVDRVRFERQLEILKELESVPFALFRKWCRFRYPNYNVDRYETIIRKALMQGLTYTASEYGISRQRVDQIINIQIAKRREYKEICSHGPCMNYMTIYRFSNETGTSLWKLQKWKREGELPGIMISGTFLVDISALQQKLREESNNERTSAASD